MQCINDILCSHSRLNPRTAYLWISRMVFLLSAFIALRRLGRAVGLSSRRTPFSTKGAYSVVCLSAPPNRKQILNFSWNSTPRIILLKLWQRVPRWRLDYQPKKSLRIYVPVILFIPRCFQHSFQKPWKPIVNLFHFFQIFLRVICGLMYSLDLVLRHFLTTHFRLLE